MKADAGQLRAALARPPADIRLFLFHGPDEASAQDHAARIGATLGPGAERVDLDGATLKADPARLTDEAAALSLFGDRRWVRVTGVGEESAEALAALLPARRAGNPVVAIAPGVRTTGAVVKLAIGSRAALAFACYQPTGQNAEQIATTIAREHGLRPVAGAAARLVEASGNDRAVMLREVEKLALFLDAAPDRPRELDPAALDAVGADIAETDIAPAVAALLDGRAAELGAELARLRDGGVSSVAWLWRVQQRLVTLMAMRAEIDAGAAPDALMKQHRIHFTETDAIARALRRWTPAMLARALAEAQDAEREQKSGSNAGEPLAAAAMLRLARRVQARG